MLLEADLCSGSTFWASGPKDKDADELDAGEDDMDIHAAPLGEDDQSEDDNEAAAAGFQDDFLIAVSSKSNDGEQADVEVKAQDAKDEDEDDDDNDGEPTAKRRKRKRSRKKVDLFVWHCLSSCLLEISSVALCCCAQSTLLMLNSALLHLKTRLIYTIKTTRNS